MTLSMSACPVSSKSALVLVLLLGACVPQSSAFAMLRHTTVSFLTRQSGGVATTSTVQTSTTFLQLAKQEDEYSDFPPEEGFPGGADAEYKGDIDWDGEWKKVVSKQGQSSSSSGNSSSKNKDDRPGKDFYKSDAEIAAIRAANKAQESIGSVMSKANIRIPTSLPTSFRSLQGDWKFWIGVLAVVSVGISLVSAAGQGGPPPDAGGDSYYI